MSLAQHLASLSAAQPLELKGVPACSHGYVLAGWLKGGSRSIIHVVPSDRELYATQTLAHYFLKPHQVMAFPSWDCLPYDRVSPAHAITAERIRTLTSLARCDANDPVLVITTIGALMQKLPPRSTIGASALTIRKGTPLVREALLNFMTSNGYSRVGKVMEPGEFAVRGSIIDVFAPACDDAVRIDLFGDEIESLKFFDTLTQKSHTETDKIEFQPVSEVLLNTETIERFRSGYREHFGAVTKQDPLYEAISAHRTFAGMEHWLPLFYERLDTLCEYVHQPVLSFDDAMFAVRDDRTELLHDYYKARQAPLKHEATYHPLPPDALYLSDAQWSAMCAAHPNVTLSPFAAELAATIEGLAPSPIFASRTATTEHGLSALENLAAALAVRKKPALIACHSQGSMERLQQMLVHHGIAVSSCGSQSDSAGSILSDAALASPRSMTNQGINLIILPIEKGFECEDFLMLSEQDILGERVIRTQKRKRQSESFIAEAGSFGIGELMVHREHGIGRFDGLITVEVTGHKHDCLKLIYADDTKLFLPVENMDLITRYGSDSEDVVLDRLGAGSWQRRKAALKNRIRMAAEELLKIAAKRLMNEAPVLVAPSELYAEFCARFPYCETEDQQQAIDDVLADLADGKPMDRLICGDVGFGKTEVAMRAAFAAVSSDNPVQVAIIAPTTLLARQHAQNFISRFRDLPFVVKTLSRLVPAKDATITRELLSEGKVDIIIGTHALLSKQVSFKNLGLVIVDEEQHFGVAQKEKLKSMRASCHVLTLSATPIPRTLQMSLTGVRDLSLITTPPVDRLAVRTFVMPFDSVVLREAILREFHRGGKVFYVTPRIKYMPELVIKLRELVPEIKIAAAHGQMTPSQLDGLMNDFYDGKYDLLLSTAIIESGLDVPTANTMIIDHAEMFGLAQLYQLRGRVGRGKVRAYAYFTLPHQKTLTPHAMKRLEVMQTLDSLGAGFALASHDMDIRGFGNLLGEEQSGHVREVGIELYQQMLEDMIDQLRRGGKEAQESTHDWSPQINLGVSVMIPESYVDDLELRMSLYKRLSTLVTTDEVESFAAELIDRFGSLPDEVKQLLEVLRIKQWCKLAGIERIDVGPKGAVLSFRQNRFAKPEALLQWIMTKPKLYKLRQDQKLVVMQEYKNAADRMEKITQSLESIAALAA